MHTMRKSGLAMLLAAFTATLALVSGREAFPQTSPPPSRIIAFADVHGAYAELLAMLREAGVVDEQAQWAAGATQVVSLGDLLDRGAGSRKVMDLLMRLQVEAAAAGGRLHVLLGNHEAMNLLGDLRYVDAEEFAAYADLETAAEREQQRTAWLAERGAARGDAFDRQFPPGYFGHRKAFAPAGRYGQWLLGLPVALVLGDTLFMHGGPSSHLSGMTLDQVNQRYRAALMEVLAANTAQDQARLERAREDPMLGDDGPNWYRGPALCNEISETDALLPLLQQFGVSRLVIGHTPTRNSRVATRFQGRVVKLDTGMNRAVYRGRAAALLIEGQNLAARYTGEASTLSLEAEGLFVAPNEIDDAAVLQALREGEVALGAARGANEFDVTVSHGGRRIPAVFQVRERPMARREVAAYRVDRLLQLGLVPVTVERELQGKSGVLQGRPRKWATQADLQGQNSQGAGWCSLAPQIRLMNVFDMLIGNGARTAASVLFDTDEWNLYSSAHQGAFGRDQRVPSHLRSQPPAPGAEMRRRLAQLDATRLQAELGDLIDARARSALLARRDALLAPPAAPVPR